MADSALVRVELSYTTTTTTAANLQKNDAMKASGRHQVRGENGGPWAVAEVYPDTVPIPSFSWSCDTPRHLHSGYVKKPSLHMIPSTYGRRRMLLPVTDQIMETCVLPVCGQSKVHSWIPKRAGP